MATASFTQASCRTTYRQLHRSSILLFPVMRPAWKDVSASITNFLGPICHMKSWRANHTRPHSQGIRLYTTDPRGSIVCGPEAASQVPITADTLTAELNSDFLKGGTRRMCGVAGRALHTVHFALANLTIP